MKTIRLSLLLTLLLSTATLFSQDVVNHDFPKSPGHVNYYVPNTQIDSDVARAVRQYEVRHFQDARAPKFLLFDQQGKFAMGIGGYVKVVSGNEFGGIINTTTDGGFQPSLIGMPNADFPHSQYRLSASTSQIFIKMVGRTKKLGNFSVYLSTNFQGNNYAPQLRQAYIKFMGFTVGQAWNTITDLAATPPTIDYASPSGWSGFLNPLIRYERPFAHKYMQAGLAAEFPIVNGTWYDRAKSIPQAVPDFTGYLQVNFQKGKMGHIRAAGLIRNMGYQNLAIESYKYKTGWGAQISGTMNMTRKLSMFYRYIYGEGIGSYINDLSTQSIDMVPGARCGMQVLPMWGMYGGLKYNFYKTMFISATYSQARLYSRPGFDAGDMFKYSQYIVTNLFWNVTPDMQVAVEYLYGSRVNQNLEKGRSNRANLMVQYSF